MKPPPDDLPDLERKLFFVTVCAPDGEIYTHPEPLWLVESVYMNIGLILVFDHGPGTTVITYDWKWIVAMTPEYPVLDRLHKEHEA